MIEVIVKVKRKGSGERYEYKNKFEISNPTLLALTIQDLIDMYNLPIYKALKIMKRTRKQFLFK